MRRIKETVVLIAVIASLITACGGAERINIPQVVIGLTLMILIPRIALMKGWIIAEKE